MQRNVDNALYFIPEQLAKSVEKNMNAKSAEAGANFPDELKPLISSAIMTNNIQVGFLAFAFGITLGLGTLYILAMNGMLLGALAALFAKHGYLYQFSALILPHGFMELTAVFICGGAGILLGYSLVDPGDLSRNDSLVLGGKDAVKLVFGVIPLFVAAAAIEGFVTPAHIPPGAKIGIALFTLLPVNLYLFSSFLRKKPARAEGEAADAGRR